MSALPKLESLAIGIYDLESFEFLGSVPKELKKLSLEATRSKRPRLDLLSRFDSLTTLYLEGQQKGIEVLAELRNLEDLTLRSISMSNLNPIRHHERLRSLGIKLGGITDLSAIEGNNSIKYLELWMIKGLTDISVIATLRALQFVFLQTLKNIKALPNLSKLTRLRRIFLDTMTGLEDVSALRSSPSLEEFIHLSARNMRPAQYEILLEVRTLKRVLVGFGSKKKNDQFERLMLDAGIEKFEHQPFIFDLE